ncbi:hypothetical protein CISG_01666 [Coccidioides immitis RMSCC 3703]|uniref:Uncharacterized protein n=2 Tax=Coccidioides immitis TaxID=5501 RepID=A0A0J8R1M9_COCIT|nr:hypothetical protein CIRG_08304 [Coccidioides immitis RMSCC 2394]KMU78626.1 hypothetical protein CISG_01666 [Coccidioides immitis RMSCC 3703]
MYRINRARHGWQANQLAHPTTARPSGCWDVGSANAKESTERELRDTDYGTLVTCGRPLNPPQCHREEITAEAILPHRLGLVAESHLMHCKERYQSRSGEFAQPSNPGWIQNPDKEDE